MDHRPLSAVLLVLGVLFILGAALLFFGVPSWLGWFGRLPGDLRIERGGTKIYVPITSMIVVSLLLTLLLNLFRRLL